jgi:polyisoprenoid-binding protein YceI
MSTTEQKAVSIPTGTWNADVVHSSVAFEVNYMAISTFTGSVSDFQATLADGLVSGSAKIGSVETKDENLKAHLLAPDWFDAEKFPEVSFDSSSASVDGNQVAFEGTVTIKSVTQPATLTGTIVGPVSDPYGNARYGLQLETTVDRTKFGLNWNAPMPDGTNALADEVTLKADLSLVEAK